MNQARITGLLLCAFFLYAASASAAQLNVKPGLWESTITTESSGTLPFDTSRLSPEQRARLEATFKKRQAQGPTTHVYKSCLTQKKLAEDPFADPAEDGESCSTKVISQSSTHWKGTKVCTKNGRRREFDVDISALSRERTKGTTFVTLSDASHTMKVRGSISSKWLGSNCGGVR